jgi:hypothetical protein
LRRSPGTLAKSSDPPSPSQPSRAEAVIRASRPGRKVDVQPPVYDVPQMRIVSMP